MNKENWKKSLETFLGEYGYSVGQLPEIAGTYQGKQLAVCADAACVWDDLEKLGCRCNHRSGSVAGTANEWHFLTINKLVEVFPGHIEHAFSNEPNLLAKFIAARRQEYEREFTGPKHTHSHNAGAKWKWPFGGWGTSGLGGALVGVGLGYDRVVLCGMPLDGSAHNGEPPWRKCGFLNEAASQKDGQANRHWKRARDLLFQGKVKSMSGRTREWLGAP